MSKNTEHRFCTSRRQGSNCNNEYSTQRKDIDVYCFLMRELREIIN